MGVFNNFPYANFHELNADWILEQVREVKNEWEEYKADMDLWKLGVDDQLAAFQAWFDNLDVQDEVRTVINELIQSGEFIEIAGPQIVSATEAWLAAHITPTTPSVDDTLSISGAAADAKVTGDQISDLKEDINEYDSEFKENKWVETRLVTSSALTIESYTNRSVQTSSDNMLTLNSANGYYSYCFVAAENIVVSAHTEGVYYAIATLENPTTEEWRESGEALYMIGTNPIRYRSVDNNLPTHNTPLTIIAGTEVVVTVNSSNIPALDIQKLEFKDIATTEDIDESINDLMAVRETFVGCNLANTTRLDVDIKNSYSASTSIIAGLPAVTLDNYSDYNSYCFIPNESVIIAGQAEENTYYAITTLTSPNYPDWQSSGSTLWNNGTSSARVRKSENNLPTESAPMSVASGTLVIITVKAGEPANLLIKETLSNTFKQSLLSDVSPYIDVEMYSNFFYYYIPTLSGKYLRYKFVHFVDASTNADGWVQRIVDLVPANKVGMLMSIVRDGEWEMAIMLKNRPDFIGTMNHGSEIATTANLYFDGVKMDLTSGRKLSCKEIRVNQKSTMYDPSDEVTIVGYHYKTHIITAEEVRIEQRIEWVTNQTLGISYCGMLPATRGNDYTSTVQVTDHAYDSKTYTEYECGTTTFNPYLTEHNDKGNTFYLRGESSKVSLSLECLMENKPAEAFTFLSDAVYYNKIYFAHNNTDYEVVAGDVWKWVSTYRIKYAGN